MRVLVVGSTGLLGQSVTRCCKGKGMEVVGVARSSADYSIDITDIDKLSTVVTELRPDIVINCAAIVNLAECESDPVKAYLVNARPASILSELSFELGYKNVFVSTDHYYPEGGNTKHTEDDPVRLVNEYARTKYVGEAYTLHSPDSLVLRTNIVGFRNKKDSPTFIEWVIGSLVNREQMQLFDDVFTSSIHVDDFAHGMYELVNSNASGIINLASSKVASKYDFVKAMADRMDIELDWVQVGSGKQLNPVRATSLGLSVEKAEKILGFDLPGLEQTASKLVEDYQNSGNA